MEQRKSIVSGRRATPARGGFPKDQEHPPSQELRYRLPHALGTGQPMLGCCRKHAATGSGCSIKGQSSGNNAGQWKKKKACNPRLTRRDSRFPATSRRLYGPNISPWLGKGQSINQRHWCRITSVHHQNAGTQQEPRLGVVLHEGPRAKWELHMAAA